MDSVELREEFERAAEWRREKSLEYPDDHRNLEAAVLLDHLAETAGLVPAELIDTFVKVSNDVIFDDENWSDTLRQVGFGSAPTSAEEMLRSFIDKHRR